MAKLRIGTVGMIVQTPLVTIMGMRKGSSRLVMKIFEMRMELNWTGSHLARVVAFLYQSALLVVAKV